MAWTKTVPTRPGWYWVRYGPGASPGLVEVANLLDNGCWAVCYIGYWLYDYYFDLFWDEPLLPPEPPLTTPDPAE